MVIYLVCFRGIISLLLGALFCYGNINTKAANIIYGNKWEGENGTIENGYYDENHKNDKYTFLGYAYDIDNYYAVKVPVIIKDSQIKATDDIYAKTVEEYDSSDYLKIYIYDGVRQNGSESSQVLSIYNIPAKIEEQEANEFINIINNAKTPKDLKNKLAIYNQKYNRAINSSYIIENTHNGAEAGWPNSGDYTDNEVKQISEWLKNIGLQYENGTYKDNNGKYDSADAWGDNNMAAYYTKLSPEKEINILDTEIDITNSTLVGEKSLLTTNQININTNSNLNITKSIRAGSIKIDKSTITATSLTSADYLYVNNGGIVNITEDINAKNIHAENGKISAKNLTTTSASIWNGSMLDISKGTLTVNGGETWLDASTGKIKAKCLKVKNTTGHTNSIGSDTHIAGGLSLNGKAQTVSAGTTNTDLINKAQMTTALSNAKPKPGKTYSAGTGINLSTNNAVGLTNAAAYATSDKKRISLVGAAKTYVKKIKAGKISATSKDLINGSQLYSVQQSIAGFANRIQTNKNQLESLKSSINAKKAELSGIQKNLNTIKGTKLSQDMSNLTADGEAVIKSQVKKAIQKFQKDMDVSTVQTNTQEAKVSDAIETKPTESCESSIMLADTPIEATNEPVNAVSAISKEEVAAKADLSQTKVNLERKATLDTMDVAAYTKQLSKGLSTGESAYHALQEAKKGRLVQAKENTLTVGANGAETKIDASKKNWTGISVDEKEAGSMANVGYVDQTLSMESSYDKLSLMKKDLEKDTNKGIAKAAALAALKPIGHDEEDKVSFAIGYGHYKDGNAAAIGTFYRPSQDILIHLDVTAGAGKPSMNTGVSFKVGKGSSYASMTREQLAEENAAMRNQAEKQAERIQTQKERIEHLESVIQSIRF